MANAISYRLSVLATSPAEINSIATRLKKPSTELVDWAAKRFDKERSAVAEGITRLVAFEPSANLFYVHESVNKARRFHNSFKRYSGIVDSHIFEVSTEFPNTLFLLEYFDEMSSYTGKTVIIAGKETQHVHDGRQHAQGLDWALPDIFAPFKAEYELGLPFGSLWDEWLRAIGDAVGKLKSENAPATVMDSEADYV